MIVAKSTPFGGGQGWNFSGEDGKPTLSDVVGYGSSPAITWWPEMRHDESAPEQALKILSTWAHIRRFPPGTTIPSIDVSELNKLVATDFDQLLRQFTQCPFPDDWEEQVKDIVTNPGYVFQSFKYCAVDAIHSSPLRMLFDQLDNYQLACYAVNRGRCASACPLASCQPHRRAPDIGCFNQELGERLMEAEGYLLDHKDDFSRLKRHILGALSEYRSDLEDWDSDQYKHQSEAVFYGDLDDTLLKHYMLEMHWE